MLTRGCFPECCAASVEGYKLVETFAGIEVKDAALRIGMGNL